MRQAQTDTAHKEGAPGEAGTKDDFSSLTKAISSYIVSLKFCGFIWCRCLSWGLFWPLLSHCEGVRDDYSSFAIT